MDARLPNFAAFRDPLGDIIIVKKGETGYWPGKVMELHTDADVERFNAAHGVTPAAIEAMHIGSMCGWEVPGAQLEAGEEIAKRRASR